MSDWNCGDFRFLSTQMGECLMALLSLSSTEPTLAPEPTDATTYKNLQHHDYNTYTFLDLNLDLSKFRMPQPSSGRESPRH